MVLKESKQLFMNAKISFITKVEKKFMHGPNLIPGISPALNAVWLRRPPAACTAGVRLSSLHATPYVCRAS